MAGAGKHPITVTVATANVKTFPPYPGHLASVFAHVPDPANPPTSTSPGSYLKQLLRDVRFDGTTADVAIDRVDLSSYGELIYLSV